MRNKRLLHELSTKRICEKSRQREFPNRYLQPKLANAVDTKRQDHAASTSGSSYKSLSWSSSAIRYWISSQSDESSIARSSLSICRSRSKDIWQETGKTIKPNSEGDATPKAQIKKRQRGYNCFDARLITNNWPWLGVKWEKRSKKFGNRISATQHKQRYEVKGFTNSWTLFLIRLSPRSSQNTNGSA